MWRTAEEITADLESGDAERVAAGLETLELHHDTMEPVAVAALRGDQLACFGDELPDEVVTRFVKLVGGYEHFAPALGREAAAVVAALAAARFGPSSLALEASLLVKSLDDAAAGTRDALAAIAAPGVVRTVEHAGDLVSYLLAGEAPVRAAVVEALADWGADPELAAIRARVLGELEDDERARLGA